MSESGTVRIGGIKVGDGYPTLFVAEVGTFFNQDVELGKKYLRQAIDAGAKVVKGEVLHDPNVCLPTGLLHEYNHAHGKKIEVYRDVIERKCISLDGYREIYEFCGKQGVPFIASIYDLEGADFFAEIGGAAFKIARHNINNFPLIRHCARKNLPIIFDAGGTYFDEVALAVRVARSEGNGGVIVNHHPGANPAAASVHNMKVMQTYKEALGVTIGFSCHYVGDEILYLAVGMGANLIEKGVVDDPTRIEQDLVSAARLDETATIIKKIQNCWEAIGQAPSFPREPRDLTTRAGLVAKTKIKKGTPFSTENVRFSFPPQGISVDFWDEVIGRPSDRDLEPMEIIHWKDVNLAG